MASFVRGRVDVMRVESSKVLASSLRDPSATIHFNAVGRVRELFGDGTRVVPCACLGTVLVSSPSDRKKLIDDHKSH